MTARSIISYIASLALVSGIFIIDRISKVMALQFVERWQYDSVPFLSFQVTFNRGLSWGIAAHPEQFFYILMAVLILFAFVGMLWRQVVLNQSIIPTLLVIAGGLSNMIDRLQYGAVVDFIDLFIGNYHVPTFNLADVYIVLGVGLLIQRVYRYGTV